MLSTGLLEEAPGEDPDGEPLVRATEWLRRAVAPLAAAARMEQRFSPGNTAPIAALDVEAALQLTLPLLKLPRKFRGACSLAVELDDGVAGSPAGVTPPESRTAGSSPARAASTRKARSRSREAQAPDSRP